MKRAAAAAALLLGATAAESQQTPYEQGVAARLAGDAEAAVASLRAAVAAEPGNADAHLQLGLALLHAGRIGEAEASFRRTLEIAPDYEDARIGLARVAQRRGDPAAARAALGPVARGNVEAEALRSQLASGSASAARTRIDIDGSYSALEGDRRDWKELSLQLRHQASERTAIAGAAEYARRFGRSDIYFEGRVEQRFSDAVSGYVSLGGTADADFRPEWQIGAGGALRVGRTDPTVPTLDARAAEYPAGRIYTLNPGVEQYLANGRVWLTGRWINLFDEDGGHVSGWLARGDLLATDRLRLFAGVSDAPDLSEGIVTDLFSVFGGLAYDVADGTTLRLSLAHEDRRGGGDRLQVGAGMSFRF